MTPRPPSAPPIAGTRVLDLVEGAGAYATRLLVGLGVGVIRVERPGGSPRDREPLTRLPYHAGKRAITLDPAAGEGRALLARLLDRVEIVLDNGQLARWGFDLDALAARRPPLVIVSVTPFGLDSPRAGWAGGDLVAQAMSGMTQLFGYRDERPARFRPEQASEMSGLVAAFAPLTALFGARRPGEGDHVDVAMERIGALVTFQSRVGISIPLLSTGWSGEERCGPTREPLDSPGDCLASPLAPHSLVDPRTPRPLSTQVKRGLHEVASRRAAASAATGASRRRCGAGRGTG